MYFVLQGIMEIIETMYVEQISQVCLNKIRELAMKHILEREEFILLDCDIDALLVIQNEEVSENLLVSGETDQILLHSYYRLVLASEAPLWVRLY